MSMSFQDARHLLARTGFGGNPAEIRGLARLDREAAIDRLLAEVGTTARTSPPSHVLDALPPAEGMKGLSVEEKKVLKQERREDAFELKG